MKVRRLLGVMAAASAVALGGCGGGSGLGPLGGGSASSGRDRLCTEGNEPRGDITHGFESFRNDGEQTVTLERVRLVDPFGLELVDARLLEAGARGIIGTRGGRPDEVLGSARWASGAAIAGATAPPGVIMNLVMWLRRDGSAKGGFERVEVDYTVGGRSYRWRSIVVYVDVADCSTQHPTEY